MQPSRYLFLLVILLAVQAWCKPAGESDDPAYSDDDPRSDYNDDETQNEDEEDEFADDDTDDQGISDDPPQILSKGQTIQVQVGGTIRLPCFVKNTENLMVTWTKDKGFLSTDSTVLSDDGRIKIQENNTLVIENATVADSYDGYKCSVLTVPPLKITHKVIVVPEKTTESPPAQPHKSGIHVTPGRRVEVSAGESLTLGCETRLQPEPKIKWYHENEKVGANVVVVDNNHITIRNINRHDGGHYQCLVEDDSTKPPIAGINVIVNYAPEVDAEKDVVHTGVGVKSELTCAVHAHPHAAVRWYKDENEIGPRKGRTWMKTSNMMHHLEIHHTAQEDFGEYRCVATNNMGQAEKTITLTGAPSQAVIYGGEMTRTDTGLILKWRLESYSPITEYKLQYRRKGEGEWNVAKPTVTNGNGNQFTVEHPIEGLEPGSYEAILMARNNFGWSEPSAPHMFTGEYAPEETEGVPGSAATTHANLVAIFLVALISAFTSL